MLTEKFNNKTVLITGGNGFIGSHLCLRFNKEKTNIYILSRNVNASIYHSIHCDINDRAELEKAICLCKPDYIFHLAAFKERTKDIDKLYEALNVNLFGTLNIFHCLLKNNINSKVVLLGTGEEYGSARSPYTIKTREIPVSDYSLAKLCTTKLSEFIFNEYQLPLVIIRPSLVYGPGQNDDMFLPVLIQSVLSRKKIEITAGEQLRDYIFIDDLVSLILEASALDSINGEIINAGTGVSLKIRELANKVEKITGYPGYIDYGAKEYRKNEVMDYRLDMTETFTKLKWRPQVTIDEGLKRTIDSYKEILK